ncbi:MAG: energy transducer TonB [Pseudomonadota bacterium]
MAERNVRYGSRKRRIRWPLVLGLAALHVVALYGLARVFAPEMTASVERQVVSAITVTVSVAEPEEPPPPAAEPEPDEGAQGDPGKEAVPQPVTAPPAKIPTPQPKPAPKASSTGTANRSGAREAGEGTGADGSGLGTGSGQRGSGQGNAIATKPEHISGGINNARDYPTPEGGRQARRGTEVIVRVVVGVDGRASQCSIYRASPDAEADAITCRLVVDRLRFRPATNQAGNPVPAPYYWRQRWF